MTKYKFEVLPRTAAWATRYIDRGTGVTDAHLAEAIDQFPEDTLEPLAKARIHDILAGTKLTRSKHFPTRPLLAQQVMQIDERIAPLAFRKYLARRLRSGNGFSDRDMALKFDRRHQMRMRDLILSTLYKDLNDLLGSEERQFVKHPIIGKMAIPKGPECRSDKAALMTAEYIGRAFDYLPSLAHVRNIASRN